MLVCVPDSALPLQERQLLGQSNIPLVLSKAIIQRDRGLSTTLHTLVNVPTGVQQSQFWPIVRDHQKFPLCVYAPCLACALA